MTEKYIVDASDMTLVADAIRNRAGVDNSLAFPDEFVDTIDLIIGGTTSRSVSPLDVNFYDYDGTLLYAYTIAEAQAMTELPSGQTHDGLIFQGWNWSLEDINALTHPMNIGAMYITDDGKTRLYITLQEGRTSPMLGVGVNGTVSVDWGDGTEPDVLTGTARDTVQWTPTHQYDAAGDYVIRLTVDGEMQFLGTGTNLAKTYLLRHATTVDAMNEHYQRCIKKVEIGANVSRIYNFGFLNCEKMTSISIPSSINTIALQAFQHCADLQYCTIPNQIISIGNNIFNSCSNLVHVSFPKGLTSIGTAVFMNCYSLLEIAIPDSIASIGGQALRYCHDMTHVFVPNSVASVAGLAFDGCIAMKYIDFSSHTSVPTLVSADAFTNLPADCKIHVPAALYDEWIAATNWTTFADYIVAV